MDKPTLSEFIPAFSKLIGVTVKTDDGRYFKLENARRIGGWKSAVYYIGMICFLALNIMIDFNIVWFNVSMDFVLAALIVSWLTPRLLYRFSRFRELEPGSGEHVVASEQKYGKSHRLVWLIVSVIIAVPLLLHSFTLTYLRSLADNDARVTSVEIYEYNVRQQDTVYASDSGGTSDPVTVTLDKDRWDDTVYLRIFTAGTPANARYVIDGRAYDSPSRYKKFSWIWDRDYFKQWFEYNINYDNIHDGSVITFDCGGLHRQWVFDVADEEAS